ncbi:hypothetical protein GOACH_24_00120 [Gordonia aichiensis NBRC 108223]|uniref:Uncharacterized protein n=1 Tax=Gordonia aichiensis NBRC 108223 TaxID=1220583 RepID=L7KPF5_9ACTN|nr:hypothetical protein GOACH_24_00120 [Gordonia aichiensis NBRC 108223]
MRTRSSQAYECDAGPRLAELRDIERVNVKIERPVIPPIETELSIDLLDIPAEGLSRNRMLEQWYRKMSPPPPEKKVTDNELRAWSGTLGSSTWFRVVYGDTTGLVMCEPKVRFSDAKTWENAIEACRETVEPLTRYTGGWASAFGRIRPPRLPGNVATAIRNYERGTPAAVRRGLVGPSGIMQTASHTTAFISDQSSRAETDIRTAGQFYVDGLATLVSAARVGDAELDDATCRRLAEHLAEVLAALDVESTEDPAADVSDAQRSAATDFLNSVITNGLPIRKADLDNLAEAYVRVHKTYVNRLRHGKPLEGTEGYLRMRLESIRQEKGRLAAIRDKHEQPLNVDGDPNTIRAHDGADDPATSKSEIYRARALVELAVQVLLNDPGLVLDGNRLWEADLAIAILRGDVSPGEASSQQLSRFIQEAWETERPANSRSRTGRASAMDVTLLMRTAISTAQRLRSETDTGGKGMEPQ